MFSNSNGREYFQKVQKDDVDMNQADLTRVVVKANDRTSTKNVMKNPYEYMKSAVLTDDDLVTLIRGKEEKELTSQEGPTAAEMKLSSNSHIYDVKAAKMFIENI